MNHSYESRPTFYNGVLFRTRLEARWACFFDLAYWKWDYEPIDLVGWTPSFRVEFPCSHTQCAGSHVLLVDVKPFGSFGRLTMMGSEAEAGAAQQAAHRAVQQINARCVAGAGTP